MYVIIILLLSVAIGSVVGYYFSENKTLSKFLLTFSGAYFLATAILEIFPTIYEGQHNHHIGLFVMLGLFFQLLVESLSKGAEHGHVHMSENQVFPVSVFIGLFLHSFFEGIPLLHQSSDNLLWAIFIHNIPVSMVLFGAVSKLKTTWNLKILMMLLFAFSGPLGALFGDSVLAPYQKETSAFVAGIFIHIATVIIFESTDNHKFKAQKVLTVLLGFVVAYLTLSFAHHQS